MAEEVGAQERLRGRHQRRLVVVGWGAAGGQRLSPFDEATTLTGSGAGDFAWWVPDGWQQARGAWGGLVVGALTRAVEQCEADAGRALRSVTLHIMAPAVVGEHLIRVRPVRIGSAMSTWSARLDAVDGTAVASLVAVCGAARQQVAPDGGPHGVMRPPAAPPATDVPAMRGGSPMPAFTQHLVVAPVSGMPLAGAGAQTLGWVDYADPTPLTSAALLALVDAWWPAGLVSLPVFPRVATVAFSAALLVDPRDEPMAGPLLHHGLVAGARDGFTSEHRQLWTRDGRLAVDNLQTVVVGA